ncbi:ribonuclease P protein component [Flavobacteriaceae bacterium TK19130]|nr:ribonuclease P protein component [Thermobacterium salinum]
MKQSFPKEEKLKSKKIIDRLFVEGRTFKKFPIRVTYLPVETLENHQAGFSVPKRNFKLAVDRNRIKRQLREAYRLQKHTLAVNNGLKFALFFTHLGNKKHDYETLERAMHSLLKRLQDENH